MSNIPDECIDLIIADPPYFRVLKQEDWDKFRNYEEYISWSKDYLSQCVKKLRLSGTLLLYGCSVSVSNTMVVAKIFIYVEKFLMTKGKQK